MFKKKRFIIVYLKEEIENLDKNIKDFLLNEYKKDKFGNLGFYDYF